MKVAKTIKYILTNYDFSIDTTQINGHEYVSVYQYKMDEPEKFKTEFAHPYFNDHYLSVKFKKNIPEHYSVFNTKDLLPKKWYEAINQILMTLIKCDSNLTINFVSLIYGGIRASFDTDVIEDIHDVETLLETELYDRKLII